MAGKSLGTRSSHAADVKGARTRTNGRQTRKRRASGRLGRPTVRLERKLARSSNRSRWVCNRWSSRQAIPLSGCRFDDESMRAVNLLASPFNSTDARQDAPQSLLLRLIIPRHC